MKLSTWRSGFLTWFDKVTNTQAVPKPTGWYLEPPTHTDEVQAFLPPLQDVSYSTEDSGILLGRATQHFYMVFRYADGLYQNLPLGYLEGIHSTFSIWLLKHWADIADLQEFRLLPIDQPVTVTESPDDQEEYIIQLHWVCQIIFVAEEENDQTPFDFKKLKINLWRWDIDGDRDHKWLDYQFTKSKE